MLTNVEVKFLNLDGSSYKGNTFLPIMKIYSIQNTLFIIDRERSFSHEICCGKPSKTLSSRNFVTRKYEVIDHFAC